MYGTDMPGVMPDEFRKIMAHFATGVAVVTAGQGEDISAATISALSSVSLEPPLFLVCLNRNSRTGQQIVRSRRFGVSILPHGQETLASYFARKSADKKEACQFLEERETCAFVSGAVVQIEAEIEDVVEKRSHIIFFASPLQVWQPDEVGSHTPLIYYRSAFSSQGREAGRTRADMNC